MLILQGAAYAHPDKNLLFTDINLAINRGDKIALIGDNGTGKSTLLKIMAGILPLSTGVMLADSKPYYVPQHFGQYNDHTVAEVLGVDKKINALHRILNSDVTEADMTILADDWDIEERCHAAMKHWLPDSISLNTKMSSLSGGQKTKVFLCGIMLHRPDIVLLDEPSNHLDASSRQTLYDYISACTQTLVVVSHDITLLKLLPAICELGKKGITFYGGDYDLYKAQKETDAAALQAGLKNNESSLRKAKAIARETMERQQKLDAKAKKKQGKAGLPTIVMNTLRNNAERSTAHIKDVHENKIGDLKEKIAGLRKELPDKNKVKIGFDEHGLHKGKILVTAKDINFNYGMEPIWGEPLSFTITSGERINISGNNGAGKTTLVRMMLGKVAPTNGRLTIADINAIYIDQDYSLINNELTVFEQASLYNTGNLEEHEIKSRLTHFLFIKEDWSKRCGSLSGGERMRMMLCCMTISNEAPDIIVLDEPTNNLDIQNVEILAMAVSQYNGTIIIISHDKAFLELIKVERTISL